MITKKFLANALMQKPFNRMYFSNSLAQEVAAFVLQLIEENQSMPIAHLTLEQAKTLKVGDKVLCIGNKHTIEGNFEIGQIYEIERIASGPRPLVNGWFLWGEYLEDFALPLQ